MKLAACWWGIAGVVATVVTTTSHGNAQGFAPAKEPGPDEAPTTVTEPAPPPRDARPPEAGGPSGALAYSHKGQVSVSARFGVGMRAIVAYDENDYCGDTDSSTATGNAPVCTGRAPLSLDLEVGYGIAHRAEAFLELRVGIEGDFGSSSVLAEGPRMFHISPGVRFFFNDSKTVKLFTTAQAVFDFSGYQDSAGMSRGADLGVRNLNGLWFDLDRAYGIYAYFGETATFSRWLRVELEAGIGLQGRYP
jgi:hypothetical protein